MNERDEEQLRRALHEVAASTAAAAAEPPPLGGATVVPLAARRRRTERWALGGVAAAVVLVAALLAGVLAGEDGDGDDETVEVADDPTTSTTDEPRSTTTSSSSTSSTATTETTATTATSVPGPTVPVPVEPSGELLARGDGWEVRRDGACVVVWSGTTRSGEECERDVDAWLLAAPLPDGRTVHVAGGRRVVSADGYARSGIWVGDQPVYGDVTSGLFVITDALPDIVLLRTGPNGEWVAGIYGGRLRTEGPAFGDQWFGYQRATGSMSFDRYMEFGGYTSPAERCAVARQVAPEPAILGTACLTGDATVAAALIPAEQAGFYEIVGIAMSAGDWRCILPDGGSCGSNPIAGIAGFGGIIAQQGPLVIDGATEVVIETDNGSVTIPVPAG